MSMRLGINGGIGSTFHSMYGDLAAQQRMSGRCTTVSTVTLDVSNQPDGYFEVRVAEIDDVLKYHPQQAMSSYTPKYAVVRGFVKDGKLHGEYRKVGDHINEHLLFIDGALAMNLRLIPLDGKLKFQLALQYEMEFL